MRTVLAWKPKGEGFIEPSKVAERLDARFSPLFKKAPKSDLLTVGEAHVALQHLPVSGWKPGFREDAGGDFAFATDYPHNAGQILDSGSRKGPLLLPLARALERDPAPLLREIAPPFAMIWSHGPALWLQVDGLGQGHWFVYEDDEVWAVSNRIGALSALGIELEPDAEDWAVRFTLGWFTGDSSGYRGIRLLGPGAQLCVTSSGVAETTVDVLREWVHPGAMSRDECLELARTSFHDVLAGAASNWTNASVGLSGGWDSRAVAACLRAMDVPFELRVRGHPGRWDVRIANELARMAELPIRIKTKGGVPPSAPDACRDCIQRALLWQSGHMTMLKHKTFLAKRGVMDGGVINMMGQHSGIGKADFAVKIKAHELRPEQYEEALLDALVADAPPVFSDDMQVRVRERIRSAYRKAHDYGLEGLHALHFFFLHEYTRRWGAATINAQNGMVVAPFLNPGLIRAAYAFDPEELPTKPFHRHITEYYAPDWAAYPYENQVSYNKPLAATIPEADVKIDEEKVLPDWRRGRRWGKYRNEAYWEQVGSPLVDEALKTGGFWCDVFEPERIREQWNRSKGAADALVIAHLLPKD